jgi:hypothetical protein
MAQKIESKEERPLQSFHLKDWLAVQTTASRIGIPDKAFYNLENAQPIGASNIHAINDISSQLQSYGADTIYYDANVNISNTEYLLQASTTGKLWAYNVASNTLTQINGAATLGGSATRIIQWNNSNALIIDSSGYYQWNGSGNIISIGGVTGAPTSGTAIAVYAGLVWIAQGRALTWSAPGSFTDFTTANGGGSVTLVDPVLRSNIQALFAANGYLYVWGISSINAISDVYVPAGASPPTPSFTNLNLSAVVGTDQTASIMTYGRLVLFANRYGAWMLYGTTVQSISSPDPNNAYQSSIDGTWQYLAFTTPISGGQVVSNNLLCAAFLLTRSNDPVFGSNTVVGMYQGDASGGKWWFANYGSTGVITRISTAFINGVPCVFAYIGNKLYQLFSNTSSWPAANIQTALWDFGDPITQKQVIRAGVGIVVFQNNNNLPLQLTIDIPGNSLPVQIATPGYVSWVNKLGATVTWVNNALAQVNWVSSGFTVFFGGTSRGFAKYVGMTLTTPKGVNFELNTFLLDYKWAARWIGN